MTQAEHTRLEAEFTALRSEKDLYFYWGSLDRSFEFYVFLKGRNGAIIAREMADRRDRPSHWWLRLLRNSRQVTRREACLLYKELPKKLYDLDVLGY